MRNFKFKQY